MRLTCFAFLLMLFPVYSAAVTTFVSPDSSFSALEAFLADAKGLKIASYTFTSTDIAAMLPEGTAVLVDASPVGGIPKESKSIFCSLSKQNISVYLYSGSLRYMHAKYAVKGNASLIASENFGDDGFPASGSGNRGWGAVVEDAGIAKQLREIFGADVKASRKFVCDGNYTPGTKNANGGYVPAFTAKRFENQSVSLVVAPNALPPLLDLVNSAKSRLLVEQFYIYRYFDKGGQSPLLDALVSAAKRGVNVSVLLDSTYYNVDRSDKNSNYYTNIYLNNVSGIESRLFDAPGLTKLHNKGVVADGAVLVSSINWNENSPTRNREIGVIIKGEAADYFADTFNHDFYPGNRITGLAAAKSAVGILAIFFVAAILLRKSNKR